MGYNLNFIPTPDSLNKNDLIRDVNKFTRRIKLKSHFSTTLDKKDLYFKSNSSWEPDNVHHTVKTFIEDFNKQIANELKEENRNTPHMQNNLSRNEKRALNDLKNRTDIVICNADKGGAVVISDVSDYVKEAERQLLDQSFYKKVPENPTSVHAALVNNAIDQLKNRNALNQKMANQLKSTNPRTPRFYLLPKIHKPNNPGRPVVSSINCHTERISQFVDHHLQPLTKKLTSYVQDTTDFLRKLQSLPDKLPENTLLVTMDVRSLYTNIPNDEGIAAVKSYLEARGQAGDRELSQVISTFLTLILTLNNFQFNDDNYVQVNGASMGTKCAPTYATLFMGKFEETHILPRIRDLVLLYVRFIDDIFFLWKGTEEDLLKFFDEINSIHPTIKFDFNYSKTNTCFLDTSITITDERKLKTSIYSKPTDRKAYLHAKSYHPKSTKEAISYSQALRIRRICTEESDFVTNGEKLIKDLVERGHPRRVAAEGVQKARNLDRQQLLVYKEKEATNRIPLIVTYNKKLPDMKNIVDKTWNTLRINQSESAKFAEKPMICFRRNRNLRDLLGQTRISDGKVLRKKELKPGRCSPCLSRPDTKCCKHIISTKTFSNRAGDKVYKIFHRVNCKSKNAIYLGFCEKCNHKPYVGKVESQGTNKRINKHRSDAKKPDSIPVDKHFLLPDHDFDRDFKLIIIEAVGNPNMTKEQTRETLLRREDFWIKKLKTLEPNGFNVSLNFPSDSLCQTAV